MGIEKETLLTRSDSEVRSVAREGSYPAPRVELATNNQKKVLSFFGIPFSPSITAGAAGWELARTFSDEGARELWRRYLYLTNDFDVISCELKPYDRDLIQTVELPDDWSASNAKQAFYDDLVSEFLESESPYDRPESMMLFVGRRFIFTGKFAYGTRSKCVRAVVELGAVSSGKSVNRNVDYLVVGEEGSPLWSRGLYGRKIEAAIVSRRENGCPAIVSEAHWVAEMNRIGELEPA